MALIAAADFRADSLAEYCAGLVLSTDEVSTTLLTATIARMSAQVEDWCNDTFSPTYESTFALNAENESTIILPHRTTAIFNLYTVDADGDSTLESADAYRLSSSLDADGAKRRGEYDRITITPGGSGLSGTLNPWLFDGGLGSVVVDASFGWDVTPPQIKRAVALLTWDHWKAKRGDLMRISRLTNANESIDYVITDSYSGIPEVDAIIREYRRDTYLGAA